MGRGTPAACGVRLLPTEASPHTQAPQAMQPRQPNCTHLQVVPARALQADLWALGDDHSLQPGALQQHVDACCADVAAATQRHALQRCNVWGVRRKQNEIRTGAGHVRRVWCKAAW